MDVLRRPDLRFTFLNSSRLASRRSADAGGFIFFWRPPLSGLESIIQEEAEEFWGIDPPSTFWRRRDATKRGEMDDSNSKICRLGLLSVCIVAGSSRPHPKR